MFRYLLWPGNARSMSSTSKPYDAQTEALIGTEILELMQSLEAEGMPQSIRVKLARELVQTIRKRIEEKHNGTINSSAKEIEQVIQKEESVSSQSTSSTTTATISPSALVEPASQAAIFYGGMIKFLEKVRSIDVELQQYGIFHGQYIDRNNSLFTIIPEREGNLFLRKAFASIYGRWLVDLKHQSELLPTRVITGLDGITWGSLLPGCGDLGTGVSSSEAIAISWTTYLTRVVQVSIARVLQITVDIKTLFKSKDMPFTELNESQKSLLESLCNEVLQKHPQFMRIIELYRRKVMLISEIATFLVPFAQNKTFEETVPLMQQIAHQYRLICAQRI